MFKKNTSKSDNVFRVLGAGLFSNARDKRTRDWVALSISIISLIVSSCTVYFANFYSNVDAYISAIPSFPFTGIVYKVEDGEDKLTPEFSGDISVTFINAGNRAIAIQSIRHFMIFTNFDRTDDSSFENPSQTCLKKREGGKYPHIYNIEEQSSLIDPFTLKPSEIETKKILFKPLKLPFPNGNPINTNNGISYTDYCFLLSIGVIYPGSGLEYKTIAIYASWIGAAKNNRNSSGIVKIWGADLQKLVVRKTYY